MPLKQNYSNLWKKLKSVPVEKKSVRESEKHGKKWTWNHFFACKGTSKRGQKMVSRAVLLFKGEETGCILIRSLHLKINFPNRKNIKCSKVKRSIKKKMRETFRKKSWEIKKKHEFWVSKWPKVTRPSVNTYWKAKSNEHFMFLLNMQPSVLYPAGSRASPPDYFNNTPYLDPEGTLKMLTRKLRVCVLPHTSSSFFNFEGQKRFFEIKKKG